MSYFTPPRIRAVLAWAAAIVFLFRAWPSWSSVVDDAYISARYAAEFAAGNGLTYSTDAPAVEGITNLAWTLLLAVGESLGADPSWLMPGLGAVFGAIAVLLATPLARALARSDSVSFAAASWALALSPHLAVASTNGLESSMMLALTLAALLAAVRDAPCAAALRGPLLATLILTRPEGSVVAVFVVLYMAWRHRHDLDRAWPVFAWAVGTLALVTVLRLLVFGMPLPNTYYAKTSFPLSDTWKVNGSYLTRDAPTLIAGLAMLAIGGLGRSQRSVRFLLVGTALALAFIPMTVYMWMPGLRLLLVPLALSVVLVLAAAERTGPRHAIASAVVLLSGLGALTQTAHTRAYDAHNTVLPDNPTEKVATWLAERLPEDAWLATRDAGVFAYYFGAERYVAELHHRALTRPHPNGDNADVLVYTPVNPEVIVVTQRREDTTGFVYGNDRQVLARTTERYRYLGRIYQHYHRYYDLYVRVDLGIDALPAEWVVSFAGPEP